MDTAVVSTATDGSASPSLPALVHAAAAALASAETAAEVLDARAMATFAYDKARSAARIATARKAHRDVVDAARRAQADALEIETKADIRLADEVDAAQAAGLVRRPGQRGKVLPRTEDNSPPRLRDAGINSKELHVARSVRDAIARQPAGLKPILEDILANGSEPTRGLLRRTLRSIRSGAERPASTPDSRPTLICGRLIERVSFFEIEGLKECALAEVRLLDAIEKHVANAAPDARVGDLIGSRALAEIIRRARGDA